MVDTAFDARLRRYAEMLATAPINLVSRRDRGRVRSVHVDEAVAIAEALPIPRDGRCLDLGSGGGLPGVVIALLRPDVRTVCLDARQKKMAFVRSVAQELQLVNLTAVASRAETAARRPDLREAFDVAVSRAVGRLAVVAELGRAFVRPGGRMIAVKGPSHTDELAELDRVRPVLDIDSIERTRLAGDRDTWLITMVVGHRLGAAIPRRDGLPQQSPLAGSSS